MLFKDFLENLFYPNGHKVNFEDIDCNEICLDAARQLWYMKIAQHIVAELYGSLLSKCEFETFVKREKVTKDNWYLFNVEPNPNQSSSEFMKQLANKLIFDLEALVVIMNNGDMYVADSFDKSDFQVAETYFSNVQLNVYGEGTYALDGVFHGDKAVYIKYANSNVDKLMKEMAALYGTLIDNVKKSGSSRIKYLLNIDTTALNGTDIDINKEIERVVKKDFKALINDSDAVMPLLNGFKLETLNPSNINAQNSNMANASVDKMYESIMAHVGQCYNVPKSFMTGTFENQDMDYFLTFGLDPFSNLVEEAFNRKMYGKRAIMQGTYLGVSTKKIKHFDILTVSGSINQLISSGVFSINEVRQTIDEPMIDPAIGDVHWITRNYAEVGAFIQETEDFMKKKEDGDSTGTVGGGLK